jgi:hypothetical protein
MYAGDIEDTNLSEDLFSQNTYFNQYNNFIGHLVECSDHYISIHLVYMYWLPGSEAYY